jgi:hypothetical protein
LGKATLAAEQVLMLMWVLVWMLVMAIVLGVELS